MFIALFRFVGSLCESLWEAAFVYIFKCFAKYMNSVHLASIDIDTIVGIEGTFWFPVYRFQFHIIGQFSVLRLNVNWFHYAGCIGINIHHLIWNICSTIYRQKFAKIRPRHSTYIQDIS